MQAIMCSEDVGALDPSTFIPVEMDGMTTMRSVPSVSLVELGKKLLLSARHGDTEEVRSLMGKGAPFTTDWLGTSALHLAAQFGHVSTAEVLLRAGISRDARTKVERTPLHVAAQEGNTAIVLLLLAHGADVDSRDMLKMTPLHWAVERGHLQTIEVLLSHGANPQAVSKFEKTPFTIAMDNNQTDILELLQTVEPVATEAQTARDLDAATLEATESLAMELEQVPSVTQQVEVETSGTSGVEQDSAQASVKSEAEVLETTSSGLQFLQAHGIAMLPTDDSTLVASAVESGQTVVLTEAGKLALGLTRGNFQPYTRKTIPSANRKLNTISMSSTKKRLFDIRTMPVASAESHKAPNILKRETKDHTEVPSTKVYIASTKNSPSVSIPKVKDPRVSPAEYTQVQQRLQETRRQVEKYRQLLSKKVQEAEEFEQKLQSLECKK